MFAGGEAFAVLELAEAWRRGCPPEAGGMMDQTVTMAEAARLAWGWEDEYRARSLGPMAAMMAFLR